MDFFFLVVRNILANDIVWEDRGNATLMIPSKEER